MTKSKQIQLKIFETIYNKTKKQGISFSEPTKTQQSFANDSNINEIVAKYTKSQLVENYNVKNIPEQYGEFIEFDYADSMDKMAKVKEDFANLPSAERMQFDNDPAYWFNTKIKQVLTDTTETGHVDPVAVEAVETVTKTETISEQVGGA